MDRSLVNKTVSNIRKLHDAKSLTQINSLYTKAISELDQYESTYGRLFAFTSTRIILEHTYSQALKRLL